MQEKIRKEAVEVENLEGIQEGETRWVLPPNSAILLAIKFEADKPNLYKEGISFLNIFNQKVYELLVEAKSDYVQVNRNFQSIFQYPKRKERKKPSIAK